MFTHFLLAFWRALLRQKLITAINISGLAIGLSVFVLIALYVRAEYSYDRHWDNADRLVRVTQTTLQNSAFSFRSSAVPVAAFPALLEYFSADLALGSLRTFSQAQQSTAIDGEPVEGAPWFVDANFLTLFAVDEVRGDLPSTLAAPFRVALSEEAAQRYFGSADPIGRVITVRTPTAPDREYEVTAVYRMREGNTTLLFNGFFTLFEPAVYPDLSEGLASWGGPGTPFSFQFFLLRDGSDIAELNRRMEGFVDQHVKVPGFVPTPAAPMHTAVRYEFQLLSDIHFNPEYGQPGGDQVKVGIFAGIAVLVLATGITNYVILALAQAVGRGRETGIRKAAGADNGNLLFQFVGEALLHAALAMVLTVIVVVLVRPGFEALILQELALDYREVAGLLVLLTLLVGAVGGWYPALVLARLRPQHVLRAGASPGLAGAAGVRKALLVMQFGIATALIVATLTLYLQMDFLRKRDPGFNPENVVSLMLYNDVARDLRREVLVNEISALPGVEMVTMAARQVNSMAGVYPTVSYARNTSDEYLTDMLGIGVGYDFFDLYGMEVSAGRSFDRLRDPVAADTGGFVDGAGIQLETGKVLINVAAAQALGFSSAAAATGQGIQSKVRSREGIEYRPIEIIGVVADNQFLSVREAPAPLTYQLTARYPYFLQVRFHDSAQASIGPDLTRIWDEVVGTGVARMEFAEENLSRAYVAEENVGRMMTACALLAIFISCLGLYGLVAFEARRMVREIAIRKVLGAGTGNLLGMFLWQFSRPVLLANILAWPVAIGAMLRWLQRFPYQLDYLWLLPLCLVAGVLVLLITWLAVALTAAKAATARPVHGLSYE